jgi:Domain of unknown function (DUF4394)
MRALLIALVALAVAAPAASAVPLVAVTPSNGLIYFDSTSPSTAPAVGMTVTGLGPNETIRGIDARPKTGELYAVTATTGAAVNSVAFTYVIPRYSAHAVLFGQTAAALAGWGNVAAGWDVNPVADRVRAVNINDENARINPFTGALAANDTDLTPAAETSLVAAAYDRNFDGTPATTLFAIDRNDSELVRIGSVDGVPASPNGGVATSIGPLGLTLAPANDAGFDIAPDGTAYAALTADADGLTRLYRIDLATGLATDLGLIGNGATEVRSLAVILPEPPGPAGPAGPGGPAGPPGPAGADVVRDRLAAALAGDRYSGRARKQLAVRFVTTVRALVTLELRRGSRAVSRVADQVGPGRARLSFRRLPKTGRYTLRLTVVAGSETVTDRASVRVRR